MLRHTLNWATTTSSFPYGTLLVNVLGSFVLAFLLFHDLERGLLAPSMRAFLGIGVLGAFTTMSTFTYETLVLYTDGQASKAGLNAALNLGASLAAAVLGRAAALATIDTSA